LLTASWHTPSLCVQWKTPDDGQRNCPKYVEFYSKNKFEKFVDLVGLINRIYHDAWSSERQNTVTNYSKRNVPRNTGVRKRLNPFFFLGAQFVESGVSCTDWIFEKDTIFFGHSVYNAVLFACNSWQWRLVLFNLLAPDLFF